METKTIKNGHLFVGVAHDIYNCEECKRRNKWGALRKNMFVIMCPQTGADSKPRGFICRKFANRYSGRGHPI